MIGFLSISLDKMLPALTSLNLLSLAVKLQVNLYPARLFAALSKLFSFDFVEPWLRSLCV